MQEPTGVPTLLPPLQRTVCSLMTSSSLSLSVSRHSRLDASRADLTHLSLTTSLLRHYPGATSLRRARTASRTPLSKSPFPGGVTCSSLSSTSSCGSPSSPPLGSPVWSSHSSSVTVSPLVLLKSSSTWSTLALLHTFLHSWMCRKVVSVGAPTLSFAALWTPCVSAIRSTLLSLSLTSRKPSTLAGSKPRFFVSTTWASQVVFGISLPISSAALWVTRLPSRGLTLASHKGGSSHLSCSICWWIALPPLSVLPSLVSALWTRTRSVTCANFTRTNWSSLLNPRPIFSMLWTCMRGVFVGGSGPLRGRPDCSVHLGGVSLPLVPQYRYLGVTLTPTLSWGPHVDLVCARGDRLFHQACAWCRGEGLSLSFSSSVLITYVLSSFGLEFVGDDSAALQQLNLSLRRWCRHLLGWPSASPVATVH